MFKNELTIEQINTEIDILNYNSGNKQISCTYNTSSFINKIKDSKKI